MILELKGLPLMCHSCSLSLHSKTSPIQRYIPGIWMKMWRPSSKLPPNPIRSHTSSLRRPQCKSLVKLELQLIIAIRLQYLPSGNPMRYKAVHRLIQLRMMSSTFPRGSVRYVHQFRALSSALLSNQETK